MASLTHTGFGLHHAHRWLCMARMWCSDCTLPGCSNPTPGLSARVEDGSQPSPTRYQPASLYQLAMSVSRFSQFWT
jgi:hypothetical protein